MTDRDAAAFCDQVRGRLVGALTLACGDRMVAEELAQDTLVRVWEQWADVSRMASPEGWTFRVGFNLASSWRRRRSAERRANRRAEARSVSAGEPSAEQQAVRAAVAGLPDRQRAVVVARFYLGCSVAETAELLGCAPGTVTATTSHALANLRRAGLAEPSDQEVEVP